eukprot:TRINITY_DN14000_c0_g1_i2.p2 TRINITY_DN14000_c0_g1~~TRINITY_DN14000_c0_g1_i2.p2  ORF type:complete len:110 (+),score=13.70 TRINITY_DN14000_c0_g1_i2:340-669(+)
MENHGLGSTINVGYPARDTVFWTKFRDLTSSFCSSLQSAKVKIFNQSVLLPQDKKDKIEKLIFNSIQGLGQNTAVAAQSEISSNLFICCLLYTSPSPRDLSTSRMPSSA